MDSGVARERRVRGLSALYPNATQASKQASRRCPKETCTGLDHWERIEVFQTIPSVLAALLASSRKPHKLWGAKWPGGLTDPSCPEEEEEERHREREGISFPVAEPLAVAVKLGGGGAFKNPAVDRWCVLTREGGVSAPSLLPGREREDRGGAGLRAGGFAPKPQAHAVSCSALCFLVLRGVRCVKPGRPTLSHRSVKLVVWRVGGTWSSGYYLAVR